MNKKYNILSSKHHGIVIIITAMVLLILSAATAMIITNAAMINIRMAIQDLGQTDMEPLARSAVISVRDEISQKWQRDRLLGQFFTENLIKGVSFKPCHVNDAVLSVFIKQVDDVGEKYEIRAKAFMPRESMKKGSYAVRYIFDTTTMKGIWQDATPVSDEDNIVY